MPEPVLPTTARLLLARTARAQREGRAPSLVAGVVRDGGIFVAYVVFALLTARCLKWSPGTTFLALAASVPPLASIWFERRATRVGWLPRAEVVPA